MPQALVGRDGSIDWLCLPRFDSGACFAALLGEPAHGRWLIAPAAEVRSSRRRYRDGTLILETELETSEGAIRIIDCMPLSSERWDVLRIVEGLHGRVAMRMELIIRFDYGSIVPWVRRLDGTLQATAGPDTLELHTAVDVRGENLKTVAEFYVNEGERVPFTLNYRPSHEATEEAIDPEQELTATEREWRKWSGRCTYEGRWRDAVVRSLITLKALTYAPTGGMVAAAHDLFAGAAGRRAQLGLPFLLAARCHVHVERIAAHRLSRRSGRLARVAAARCGRLA
jgi:GH15 family glucan-1,4-alpha-glucosidase